MASYHPGRASQVIDEALRPVLEPLESRTLLSVSLDNGTLSIVGTNAADQILVRPSKSLDMLKVGFNGQFSFFKLADVTAINIDAGGGNDSVMIPEIGAPIEVPATILGGAGNDSIQGGGGNDLLVGGDGDDSILGGRGDDNLQGGAGSDTLLANGGKDSLDGGDGHDRIVHIGSDDSIISSSGDDDIAEGVHPLFPIQTFTDVPGGYSVRQMRNAYGFGDLDDPTYKNRGKGQTLVIVIPYHSPRARKDLISFAREENTVPGVKNLNKYFSTHFHQVWMGENNFKPADDQATGEAMLDIEWAHAIAPEAKIILVEAQSFFAADVEAAISRGIDILNKTKNHGGALSMSFGFPVTAPEQVAYETLFTSDRAKNISFIAASGDTGGVTSGTPVGPPTVTIVGGTKLYLDPFGNRVTGYINEAPIDTVNGGLTPVPPLIDNWNHDINCFPPMDINDDSGVQQQTGISGGEGAWWDGSGGPSDIFDAPLWQQNRLGGILRDTDNNGIPNRGTPDVAWNADPATGVPVFNSMGVGGQSGWATVGGTSAGAPQFAGLITLANQLRAIGHKPVLGASLNERIYRLGGTGPDKYFNDIDVHGSGLIDASLACNSPGTGRNPNAFVFPATPGWDYATGWGSPNARTLLPALAEQKLKFTSRRTVKFTGRISQRVFRTVNGQPSGSTLDFLT